MLKCDSYSDYTSSAMSSLQPCTVQCAVKLYSNVRTQAVIYYASHFALIHAINIISQGDNHTGVVRSSVQSLGEHRQMVSSLQFC